MLLVGIYLSLSEGMALTNQATTALDIWPIPLSKATNSGRVASLEEWSDSNTHLPIGVSPTSD
jgi:hypothetical protein